MMTDRPLALIVPAALLSNSARAGSRDRRLARLRLSVSGLAVLCVLGAAALPRAAIGQTVTGVNGMAGENAGETTPGAGGAGAVTTGPYTNTGGAGGVGESGAGSAGLGANGSGGAGGAPPAGSSFGSIGGGGGGSGGGAGNFGNGGGGGGGAGDYSGVAGGGGGGGGGAGITLSASQSNSGSVTGGYGGDGGYGGYNDGEGDTGFGGGGGGGGAGIYASGPLTLTNQQAGRISGGAGGYGGYGGDRGYGAGGSGGGGGAGVAGTGFTLANLGSILGGAGGYGSHFTGYGGAGGAGGAGIAGSNFTATNSATITGGIGGNGADGYYGGGGGGVGGAGAQGSGFVLNNSGTVTGGAGGNGGNGEYVVDNTDSADSVSLVVTGGSGATGSYNSGGGGGTGGAGIGGTGFTVTNTGAVIGGAGGSGGAGYERKALLLVTDDALAPSFSGGAGGVGGAGIAGSGFSVTNSGAITGGVGGAGGNAEAGGIRPAITEAITPDVEAETTSGAGGAGGAGISGAGFSVTNTGSITGGAGGLAGSGGAAGSAGAGGVGIVSTGGSSIVTSGSISGGLGGDGTTQADAVDFSGGGNTLTLENGYKFTGNVVSTSGAANGGDTLALGGSGSFDLSEIAASAPTSWTGTPQFYGFADFAKTGGGTTLLTGKGTGNFSITDGTLEVGDANDIDTELLGNVSVFTNGILRGHGTVIGDVTNAGNVSPGGSLGILTVNGNYVQDKSGTLNIEVTPLALAGGGYDRLQVNGKASLAGTLAVTLDQGNYSFPTTYDILTATGGVSGTFGTVDVTKAIASYFTTTIVYDPNAVLLELSLFDRSIFSTGRLYVASNFAQNNAVLETLESVAGPATDDQTDRGYWVHGIGSFGSANGYDINSKGFVVGKGFDVSPNLVVGGAISNIYSSTAGGGSDVRDNSAGLLLYGIYTQGPITVSADIGAGHLGSTFQRTMPAQGVTGQSSSNGTYEGAALRAQYALLDSGPYFLAPYGTASYLHTLMGSAQESGAGVLNLRYDGMQSSLAQFGAGVIGGYATALPYATLTAWASLGGQGTLGNPHIGDTESVLGFSGRENALAAPVGAVTPAAGLALAGKGPWSADAYWAGQYGSATTDESFGVQAKYAW